ncbi:MAG: ABC transporter substrate-binding protein, partial [Myxococcales bacterium]|nr:ABC transporter substrate-binding protein [Myxococcales bacterium]
RPPMQRSPETCLRRAAKASRVSDGTAHSRGEAGRHPLGTLAALLLLPVLLLGAVLTGAGCERQAEPKSKDPRFVSLAPAITETLFAIGAGEQVVAVSQYCERPPEARRLPRVGTALTPNYEAIARLQPTLILTETNKSAKGDQLKQLGQTLELPWLTLPEITGSIRKLGEATGHSPKANEIAQRMTDELSKPPPVDAPRVLLVLGYAAKPNIDEVWFIRRNSLHGAALASAGGRNVVDRDVEGLPRLTVPQLLELDPDVIIVLVQAKRSEEPAILAVWKKLEPLKAVKDGRVAVLEAPEAFGNGPSILELRQKLARELRLLKPSAPSASNTPPSTTPSGGK